MKNKTLVLTRALLNNGGGFGFNLKNKWSLILLIIILVWSVPATLFGYVQMISFLYEGLATIGQEGVLLSWGLVVGSLMVFVFGIFHVLSSFYFANDIENLLPLPVRPRQIVGAKFLVVVLWGYLLLCFSFLSLLIYYGIRQGSGVLYYLYGLIILIFMPIMPLALGALLVMLIMRVTNLTRYRELLKIIGGTFAVLLGLTVSFSMQRLNQITPEEIGELLQAGSNSLALLQTKLFPTVKWAVQALLHFEIAAGLTNLLIFIGLSVAIFAALLFLAELIYFKGVVGISESSSRRHVVREDDLHRLVKQRSALTSYLLNEIRLLVRTPVYFLNCVLMNFLWPLFLIFSFVFVPDEGSTAGMLASLADVVNDPNQMGTVLGVVLAVLAFVGGSNGITATSISREGQELYVKHYIPVSYSKQIIAKLLSGIVIGYAGVVVMIVPLSILLKAPLYFVAILLILGLLPLTLTSMAGLLFDLFNPKLEWDSEQKAVKQNVNVFYSILFSTVIAIIMIAVTFVFKLSLAWALLVLPSILLVICLGLYYLLRSHGIRRFKALEG